MCWCVRTNIFSIVFVITLVVRSSIGEYDCLCNYIEESSVFPEPNSTLPPIGYLYEFDCKPLSTPQQTTSGYYIIQYSHQLGYMQPDPANIVTQICSGNIPKEDQVTMASHKTDRYVTTVTSHFDVTTDPISTTTTVDAVTTTQTSVASLPSSATASSPSFTTTSTATTTATKPSSTSVSTTADYTDVYQPETSPVNAESLTSPSAFASTISSEPSSQAIESSTQSTAVHTTRGSMETKISKMTTPPSIFNNKSSEKGAEVSPTIPTTTETVPYVTSTMQETTVTSSIAENFTLSEMTSSSPNRSTESVFTTTHSMSSTDGISIPPMHTSKTSTVPSAMSTKMSTTSTKSSTVITTTETPETTTKAPLTWPSGTYGLMEPVSGCPDDGYVTWEEGWRFQDTEGLIHTFSDGNTYSHDIAHYVKGTFSNNDIKTYFCMKTREVSNQYDHDWPSGSYCILRSGHCPKGFSVGSIFWDDVILGNNNDKGGTLPDGVYSDETKIFYCCRNDGSADTPIVLPTSKPFILLRYGNVCQSVQAMKVLDIFVHWDDQNLFNSDSVTGMHPFDDGDGKNHRLHFCHYNEMGRD